MEGTPDQLVTVQMSAELLEQLGEGWSPPVQIRVDPPVEPGTHWIMSTRTHQCAYSPVTTASIDPPVTVRAGGTLVFWMPTS